LFLKAGATSANEEGSASEPLHTAGVTGSIPVPPTTQREDKGLIIQAFFFCALGFIKALLS